MELATYQFSGRLLRRLNFTPRNPMGTVKRLAEEVERGLREMHPELRKMVVSKLSLAVGAMIEGQTPNTVELANLLPLETERQDMREQWLRRFLKNPLVQGEVVMEPLARQELEEAARHGQVVQLSLDQTDLGDRMAVPRQTLTRPLIGVATAGIVGSKSWDKTLSSPHQVEPFFLD
jgi:hypothetical protein